MPRPVFKLSLTARLLYVVATLPFILLAILYFSGAFHRSTPPAAPVTTPHAVPTRSASPEHPAQDSSATNRGDETLIHPPGLNAADFYKTAWGLFKALNLTDDEKKLLNDRSGKWDPEKAKELFEKLQPIMDELRQARDATYADWGLGHGPMKWNTPMPQIFIVNDLNRLIAWNSAYEFSSDPKGAVADLALSTGLSQSAQGTLIGALVAQGGLQMTTDVLRENATALSPELIRQALQLSRTNADQLGMAAAIRADANAQQSFIDSLRDPATQDEALRAIHSVSETDYNLADAQQNVPQVIADMQWGIGAVQDFADQFNLPEPQFQAWLSSLSEHAKAHPYSQTSPAFFQNIRARYLQTTIQNQMLQTGLSLLQTGNSALAKYPDPTTGAPFQLVTTADGFELQSTYQYKGKPVSMAFPTPHP